MRRYLTSCALSYYYLYQLYCETVQQKVDKEHWVNNYLFNKFNKIKQKNHSISILFIRADVEGIHAVAKIHKNSRSRLANEIFEFLPPTKITLIQKTHQLILGQPECKHNAGMGHANWNSSHQRTHFREQSIENMRSGSFFFFSLQSDSSQVVHIIWHSLRDQSFSQCFICVINFCVFLFLVDCMHRLSPCVGLHELYLRRVLQNDRVLAKIHRTMFTESIYRHALRTLISALLLLLLLQPWISCKLWS